MRRSAFVAAAAALACLLLPAHALAQTTPQGCGYGTGGPNASTLCWIDMSGYVDATARSAGGQPMSVTLPGGYTISFTVTSRGSPANTQRAVAPVALPTNGTASYIGNTGAYAKTPGKPALYTGPGSGATTTTLTLSNIQVRDAANQPVSGYAFVGADAENTNHAESITWTSDQPIYQVAALSPFAGANGCQNHVSGLGTTTVSCTGNPGPGGTYGTVIVAADSPTTFSQALYNGWDGSREAVAFAIMTSKIQVTKNVVGRVRASDSFDVSARSPEGSTIASASTGSASTATTGKLTVLPRTNGSSYTLAEVAGAGTRLADYSQSWACTNNGVAIPALGGVGTSRAVAPEPGDDIECTVTNAQLPADLQIVKTASPSPVVPGREASFSLTVTNDGPSRATNVVVTDALPDELTFASASPGCTETGGTVTCTVASLAPGDSQTFTVTGNVASSLDHCLENTATVSSATPDASTSDNTSSVCVPIRGEVDLSIVKTASTTALPVGGGQVMYTLVVHNDGPSDATGVTVTDPLAPGLTLVAADASQGSCTTTGGEVSCDLGKLVPGGEAQVLVTAQAASTAGARTNTAIVSADQTETDPDDNRSSATVTVPPPPPPPSPPPPPPPPASTFDLAVTKTASPTTVSVGQPITYTVAVTNRGPAAAPGVKVIDTFSAPGSVRSVKTTAGSCTKALTCSLGTIPAGGTVTITVVLKPRTTGGRQRNAASATGIGPDKDPSNNLATADATVKTVKLRLTKVASARSVRAGGKLGYTIRVRNPTRGEARNVRVCDRLPSGTRFTTTQARQRCWTVKRLGARRAKTFTVTVRVLPGATGRKVNRATASGADVRGARAQRPVRVRDARGGLTG